MKKQWARLHAGDAEPLPKDPEVLEAWVLFHNGEFQQAAEAGLKAGGDGITVANKATAIYANYLEKKEKTKLDLFMEVAQRAEAQAGARPEEPQRLVLAGLCAGALQPGHQRRQGAGAGPGQQGEGSAGKNHQAAAQACRRAHRPGRLPRRSHRQGRLADRRHDLRREEGRRPEAVPGGAQDQPGFGRSA